VSFPNGLKDREKETDLFKGYRIELIKVKYTKKKEN
jgi:hypothetical protein